MPQSTDIVQNSDGSFSNFRIFGHSFINKNCHDSRTSHDTDMKLGPVIKLDKKKTVTLKKFDDDVMSAKFDVTFVFPIYGQLAIMQKPNSGCMVYKTYIFNNNNFSFYKN